jgi:hypothetical protein
VRGPAKHRLHDYEEGWLTLLLQMGVVSERELRSAQARFAQQAIDEMEAKRQSQKRRRRKPE